MPSRQMLTQKFAICDNVTFFAFFQKKSKKSGGSLNINYIIYIF